MDSDTTRQNPDTSHTPTTDSDTPQFTLPRASQETNISAPVGNYGESTGDTPIPSLVGSSESEDDDDDEFDMDSEDSSEMFQIDQLDTDEMSGEETESVSEREVEELEPINEEAAMEQVFNNLPPPATQSESTNTTRTAARIQSTTSMPSTEDRMCWICLSSADYSESDNTDRISSNYQPWINPCRCKGTQAWVHQACLRRWIDMKQKGDLSVKVKCAQCNYTYKLETPGRDHILIYGKRIIELNHSLCMMSLAAGGVSLALYASSAIGGVIATRVLGQQAVTRMSRGYPITCTFTMSCIPPALIFTRKMFVWEAPVMKLLAHFTEKTREEYDCSVNRIERTLAPSFNTSKPRMFFGALSTPFIGSYIGEKVFDECTWFGNDLGKRLMRCVAGSALYVGVKCVVKTVYLYRQNEAHKHARIQNFKRRRGTNRTTTRTISRIALPSFS